MLRGRMQAATYTLHQSAADDREDEEDLQIGSAAAGNEKERDVIVEMRCSSQRIYVSHGNNL